MPDLLPDIPSLADRLIEARQDERELRAAIYDAVPSAHDSTGPAES